MKFKNDVTRTKFNCKAVEITEIEKINSKESGRKNHQWTRRIKIHSRTSPEAQFKEFSLTKQKTRPRTDYKWIGETISKKIRSKKSKKQKIKVKLPHVNKLLARKQIFCSNTVFSLCSKI